MLTKSQEKLIRSLQTNKGREASGLCLVEGEKVVEAAGDFLEFTFSENDTKEFRRLVTTVTPQMIAGVARIPEWKPADVKRRNVVVILDGVQDPGNVGAILRLCLGFDAGLVLIESADSANPKVVRSSAGALFQVPWIRMKRSDADAWLETLEHELYRLEKRPGSTAWHKTKLKKPVALIAGSEGRGIRLEMKAPSIHVEHSAKLESLNVANALAIALHALRNA